MGLEFAVKAEIKGRGMLRRKPGRDVLFADIGRVIAEWVEDPLARQMLRMQTWQHELFITPHPAAESIRFSWSPTQVMEVSAKTSGVGPGYHAFVTDLVDHVGGELSLNWDWQDADETGYVPGRDFAALRHEMGHFLKSLAKVVFESSSGNGSDGINMVNMRIGGVRPLLSRFTLTPMGPLSRDWWQELLDAGPSEVEKKAPQFYPWWNRDRDSLFWRNTAHVLLWCEVPWRAPDDVQEESVSRLALDCLQRAVDLDPGIDVPAREMQELRRILCNPEEESGPPAADGIGYRRHLMAFPATGHWTVALPGYFHQSSEDDDHTVVFWFEKRTVRVSSFTLPPCEDGRHVSPRMHLPEKTPDQVRGGEIVDHEKGNMAGWATVHPVHDDDADYQQLDGFMALGDSLCILTVCYETPADREWAIEVFRSLSHPG